MGGEASVVVPTDANGRAQATLTLGPAAGITHNLVQADAVGNSGAPVTFSALAETSGDPAATRITGVVLDNTSLPVPGVTVTIPGTAIAVPVDPQGQFLIQSAPVGNLMLHVDGSTAQRPGAWPSLEYALVTVPGRNNTVGQPIYLLPLDLPNGLQVSETQGGTITLPGVPGFSLTVAPGAATFPGGSKSGLISVTVVHADKVPMAPNFGQQPRLVVTIQPPGVLFEPPAQVSYPNLDGLAPGEVTEFYSFDHDMGTFVAIGTGSVSEDGMVVRSDPGVGILKGGWQCAGNPQQTGSCQNSSVRLTPEQAAVALKLQSSIVLQARGTPPSSGDRYTWTVQELAGTNVVSLSVDSPQNATPNRATITGQNAGTVRVTVFFRPADPNVAPAFDQIEIIVAHIKITTADIRQNRIEFELQHPTLQGQVALELIGIEPTNDHLMLTTSLRGSGNYTDDKFVLKKLNKNERYQGLRATWLLLSGAAVTAVDDEFTFPRPIKVLGNYRHSTYTTPRQGHPTCQQ